MVAIDYRTELLCNHSEHIVGAESDLAQYHSLSPGGPCGLALARRPISG